MSTAATDIGMTGMLSGSGHDQLRVTVATSAVPQHAPAELEGSVTPVYDDDGHLFDWRLDPPHGDHALQSQDLQRFSAWRAGFATERYLGERITLMSFLNWAHLKCDASALQVLRLDHAHLNYHRSLELDRQLGEIRRYLDRHPANAYGLFSPAASKPIRGIIPAAEPATVLALGRDSVTIAQDGLHLLTGSEDVPVQSWVVDEGRVTANGSLDLGLQVPGRLLRIVGRQAPAINVKACPVVSLIAPLLSFGRQAAELAGTGRTGMHFRSSWN